MGSKQSKRSVDISGKEGDAVANSGGEVVAAGGEGRVEPIADIDTLKPQLNGDTPHIEPPEQISDKDKQLENGAPENEKDATETETVVTNGSGEEEQKPEQENGEAKPAAEADSKKNKKDKATEASAIVESKSSDETVKVEEPKDEKTPETPVTEPITNTSSTPQTPAEAVPIKEASPVLEKPSKEVKPFPEPEKLAVNGLFLEDKEEKEETKMETKLEETVPAPELPVSSEDSEPVTENSDKINVAEINPDKIADLKEAASATLAAATAEAGAGDGAPGN